AEIDDEPGVHAVSRAERRRVALAARKKRLRWTEARGLSRREASTSYAFRRQADRDIRGIEAPEAGPEEAEARQEDRGTSHDVGDSSAGDFRSDGCRADSIPDSP